MSAELPIHRPNTRGDCERGPRPCPWITCRHYLWPNPTGASCVLDVAAKGALNLSEIGRAMGVNKKRAAAIEKAALRKVGPKLLRLLEEARALNVRRAEHALARVASPPLPGPMKRGRSQEAKARRAKRRLEIRQEARRKAREAA